MRFFIRLAVLATAAFAASAAAFAAEEPIVLQAARQTVLVDHYAAWLKDPGRSLTLDGAYARRADFIKSQNSTLNFGLSTAFYWLRFEVENPSPLPRQWIYEASDTVTDYVDIHVRQPDGGWEHKSAGDRVLPGEKEIDPRKPSFLFTAPPHARQEVFVQYRMDPVGALNLTAHLHSPDQYGRDNRTEAAVVAVEDNGVGIAPALIPRLFTHEIKISSPGTAGEKGSGLGLPYCMDIMRVHGGGSPWSKKPPAGRFFLSAFHGRSAP